MITVIPGFYGFQVGNIGVCVCSSSPPLDHWRCQGATHCPSAEGLGNNGTRTQGAKVMGNATIMHDTMGRLGSGGSEIGVGVPFSFSFFFFPFRRRCVWFVLPTYTTLHYGVRQQKKSPAPAQEMSRSKVRKTPCLTIERGLPPCKRMTLVKKKKKKRKKKYISGRPHQRNLRRGGGDFELGAYMTKGRKKPSGLDFCGKFPKSREI